MTITIEKQIKQTEQVELSLPAYFSEGYYSYCIKEDESIVEVFNGTGYSSLTVTTKNNPEIYNRHIVNAAKSPSISEESFMQQLEKFTSTIASSPITL